MMADVVINLEEWQKNKKMDMDKWLDKRVAEQYDDDEYTVKNPPLRLLTLYDLMGNEEKQELFGYVKAIAMIRLGEKAMREQFWTFVTASRGSWGDIEEYGKSLIRVNIVEV